MEMIKLFMKVLNQDHMARNSNVEPSIFYLWIYTH